MDLMNLVLRLLLIWSNRFAGSGLVVLFVLVWWLCWFWSGGFAGSGSDLQSLPPALITYLSSQENLMLVT